MRLYEEIEKYFPIIEKEFSKDDMNEFINHNYDELIEYHFGLGTWIRNNILKNNSYLFNLFIKVNIIQKDDMLNLIINLFYISMQEKYFNQRQKYLHFLL